MIRRLILFLPALAAIAALGACSVDTELGGVAIPNARPDTRLTGAPPTLLEAGFAVEFNWTGYDPDGKIVGYEWKISDNGLDGISPRDTLTVDPLTGAVLNPWRYTTANDSTFFVLADQANFPGDPAAGPRSFRSHSLFVRAVDDKGAKDPTPAYVSFTSTTLVPTIRASFPGLEVSGVKQVPTTVNIGWSGADPDFELNIPTKVRFLWMEALDPSGNQIRDRFGYDQWASEIMSFDDPDWSDWIRYKPLAEDRRVSFKTGLEGVGKYFLFAVQAQDTAGAVSVGLGYQREVAHLFITSSFRPGVIVSEPYLGTSSTSSVDFEIAANQPLNFSWSASGDTYNGKIVYMRHGWDLTDYTNFADPGWAVPPGLSEQNTYDEQRAFANGSHTFYLLVEDDSGTQRLMKRNCVVIPYVDPRNQLPLLVIDQTLDNQANNWVDPSGVPLNDETYRNAFWHFLGEGLGGVTDLNWERDWVDHRDNVKYADVVNYKAVLIYARASSTGQLLFNQFRPDPAGRDQFVWMAPYQARGGNLFLVGAASMESFLAPKSNYAVPIIFTSREEFLRVGNSEFIAGFGTRTLPDDTEVERGPLMYPYATAGVSALDWTSPNSKYIYGRTVTARLDRAVSCNGLKGLALDKSFKAHLGIGPGVVADTMWTNPSIDWQDAVDARADTLKLFTQTFPYSSDEFVNSNISTRSTPLIPQECDWPDAPGGMCIEPMYTGIARFDWLREYRWRRGETDWPFSRYHDTELVEGCGGFGLTNYGDLPLSTARTNGKVFGYFSYKMIEDKPSQKADVYWGFDPSRFDNDDPKNAVRWGLQSFGLSTNQ